MSENLERDFKGIWIPKEVYLDTRLTALDKIVLVEINSLDNEGGCFAPNKYLAEFCQCSESNITKAISKLTEFGYVEMVSFDGRHRVLKTNMLPSKKSEADPEKVRPSNIVNNTPREVLVNKSTNTGKNSSQQLFGREVSTVKKQKDFITMKKMIDVFTGDEKLRNILYEYLKFRKSKGLLPAQWEILLSSLENDCECYGNIQKMIECVTKAYGKGYMGFYPTGRGKQSAAVGKFNDPILSDEAESEHQRWFRLSAEEKKAEIERNLARDENGDPIVY